MTIWEWVGIFDYTVCIIPNLAFLWVHTVGDFYCLASERVYHKDFFPVIFQFWGELTFTL